MDTVIEQTQTCAGAPPVMPEHAGRLSSNDHWQNRLAERFRLREPDDVLCYLSDNPFLVPLVLEARDKAHEYFSERPPLVLHLAEYPDDGSRELFLLIQTAQPPAAALAKLDRFDQEWWLDALERAEGKLNVKLEYL